jgi:hypothetical protein
MAINRQLTYVKKKQRLAAVIEVFVHQRGLSMKHIPRLYLPLSPILRNGVCDSIYLGPTALRLR